MKQATVFVGIILLFFVMVVPAASDDREAAVKSMVEKAVAMVKEKGMDATLKAINDLKGPFVKGNLYVFAVTLGRKNLASGSLYNKHHLGTVSKKPHDFKMAEIAKNQGSGWVAYPWPKPNEKTPTPKRSFIMRVPGEDAYFGCGYYLK